MKKQLLFILLIVSGFGSFGQNFQWVTNDQKYDSYESKILLDGTGNIYQYILLRSYDDYDSSSSKYIHYDGGSLITKQTISGKILWKITFPGTTNSMELDKKGNVYLTGSFIGKSDFDPGKGIAILNSEGSGDAFILKFNTLGRLLIAKSIGGKNSDLGSIIELDNAMNINVIGTFNGLVDFDPGVATYKINSYGTFNLKLDTNANFISVKTSKETFKLKTKDTKGNLYTTGSFSGQVDFDPDSINTFYLTSVGNQDIFVQKLDPKGKFIWAKSMGGKITDIGNALAIDKLGNVYTTGSFEDSIDLDPSGKNYYLGCAGKTDAFISKLDSLGNFVWGLSMGGIDVEVGSLIAIDDSSNVYCTGVFEDTVDFDPGTSKYKLGSSWLKNIFILKVNSSGNFLWAKRLGGDAVQTLTSILIDKQQNIYASGNFRGTIDFNPDLAKFELSTNLFYSSFVLKLGPCPSPAEAINGQTLLCPGEKATYSISPAAGATGYKWTVPSGTNIDSGQNSNVIHITFGKVFGHITVIPNNICDTNNITSFEVKSRPLPKVGSKASPAFSICKGSSVTLNGIGGITYSWSGGISNGVPFTPDNTSRFAVTATDINGCSDTNSILIKVNPLPKIGVIASPYSIICSGGSLYLQGTGANSYSWTGGIKDGYDFTPQSTSKFVVTGTDINGCKDTASHIVKVIQRPIITLQPKGQKLIVGNTAKFIVSTTSPTAKFTWIQANSSGSRIVNNNNQFSGATDDTLIIKNLTLSENYTSYLCNVYEELPPYNCKTSSSYADLYVTAGGMHNHSKDLSFSIFPNPATNQITIESNHTLNNEPYSITDQTGRQILSGLLNNKTNAVDISTLAKGLYFIQIGEVKKETFKIVKQ